MRAPVAFSLLSLLATACAGSDFPDRIPPPSGNGDGGVDPSGDGSPGPESDANEAVPTLHISEIMGGTAVKYVEIYNSTSSEILLTGWSIRRYANGALTPGAGGTYAFPVGTSIESDQAMVVTSTATAFASVYGEAADLLAPAATISGNGDDVYELVDGGEVMDIYGVVGVDGTGKEWDYANQSARRNPTVINGTTTWSAEEWTISSIADATPKVR